MSSLSPQITTELEALKTNRKLPHELQQDVESLRQFVQKLANNNLKVKSPPQEEAVSEDAHPQSPRAACQLASPKASERLNGSKTEVNVSETNS